MAKAASRATTLTTLVVGKVEMAVGLFSSRNAPGGLVKFDTAGPHGGVLEARQIARPVPVDETVELPDVPVHSDPLAEDPGPALGAPEPWAEQLAAAVATEAPELRTDPASIAGGIITAAAAAIDAVASAAGSGENHAPSERLDLTAEGIKAIASFEASVPGEYGRELVEQGSGEVVLPQDVRRGVRLENGKFIDCTEQIAAIEETTKLDQVRITDFVDSTRLHRARIVNAYYLGAADEKAPKPMRLIYEALRATRRVAVVKVTKKSRQSLGAITTSGKVLMLLECVWGEDLREPPAKALAIQKATVAQAEIDQAVRLVEAMSGSVSAMDELRDDALALREVLHAKALAGEVAEVVTPPEVTVELDLEAALEASLAAVTS